MMLTIKKFENGQFGHLTSLKSEATGKVMFVAKEVCNQWGHKNVTQAIKAAKLIDEEILLIKKSTNNQFFMELSNLKLVGGRSSTIQLISESGLYKLAISSRKIEGVKLRHWIANEVLPSLRRTGSFVMPNTVNNTQDHQSIPIQKNNSKDINRVNFENGGIVGLMEYNTKSCVAMTGKKPSEIKAIGKTMGLKSSERTSSKEVLRHIKPELACTMSFIDNAVKQGQSFDKYVELGKKFAAALFKAMIESGLKPGELSA